MDDMIQVLDSFLPLGSELWLFSEVPVEDREERLKEGGLDPANLKNVMLVHEKGNPVNRRHLELLPLEDFDSVGGKDTRGRMMEKMLAILRPDDFLEWLKAPIEMPNFSKQSLAWKNF